jgi:hypothetical protein
LRSPGGNRSGKPEIGPNILDIDMKVVGMEIATDAIRADPHVAALPRRLKLAGADPEGPARPAPVRPDHTRETEGRSPIPDITAFV